MKKIRHMAVNEFEILVENYNMNKLFIGHLTRNFHTLFILIFILFVIFVSQKDQILYLLIILASIGIVSLIFDGCIMTHFEYKMTRENYTLVDHVVNFFNFEATNNMRKLFSSIIFFILFLILFYKYHTC